MPPSGSVSGASRPLTHHPAHGRCRGIAAHVRPARRPLVALAEVGSAAQLVASQVVGLCRPWRVPAPVDVVLAQWRRLARLVPCEPGGPGCLEADPVLGVEAGQQVALQSVGSCMSRRGHVHRWLRAKGPQRCDWQDVECVRHLLCLAMLRQYGRSIVLYQQHKQQGAGSQQQSTKWQVLARFTQRHSSWPAVHLSTSEHLTVPQHLCASSSCR